MICVDKTKKYKLVLVLLCVITCLDLACSLYTLPSESVLLFSFNLGIIGASVIPIIPVSYAFAVELTFPVSEALSNGMMVLSSQIYGTLVVRFELV